MNGLTNFQVFFRHLRQIQYAAIHQFYKLLPVIVVLIKAISCSFGCLTGIHKTFFWKLFYIANESRKKVCHFFANQQWRGAAKTFNLTIIRIINWKTWVIRNWITVVLSHVFHAFFGRLHSKSIQDINGLQISLTFLVPPINRAVPSNGKVGSGNCGYDCNDYRRYKPSKVSYPVHSVFSLFAGIVSSKSPSVNNLSIKRLVSA